MHSLLQLHFIRIRKRDKRIRKRNEHNWEKKDILVKKHILFTLRKLEN